MAPANLVDLLTRAVRFHRTQMGPATDYRLGKLLTEYLLTADIARSCIQSNIIAAVEALNRRAVNPLTSTQASASWKLLGQRRTDVTLGEPLIPDALVEVKIDVATGRKPASDLAKMGMTLALMDKPAARNIIGASVYEVHVQDKSGAGTLGALVKLLAAKEARIEQQIKGRTTALQQRFDIAFHALQAPHEGVFESEFTPRNGGLDLDENGHGTHFWAAILTKK